MLRPSASGFDVVGLDFPDVSGRPILRPDRTDPAARLLRHLATRGSINGHRGVIYDNRDRGHSTLRPGAYPSLTRLRYTPSLEAQNIGLAGNIHIPGIVVGNASMAVTGGARPRSLPRLAMTTPGGAQRAYSHYINNRIYLHPEHRDHDAVDLFPANWPFTVTSQGSSGSDKAFLHAFLMTLAAFPPDTVDAMTEHGLVAPTLQMIMRRNLKGIDQSAEYYSGSAHPPVFDGADLRVERMMGQAAAMTTDMIPPMVRLEVIEEDFAAAAGLSGQSERLFDTPAAIGRLWRGFEGRKTMRVTARGTIDPLDRKLTYRWVLLRGDPTKIKIEPDRNGDTATVSVDWHDAYSVPGPEGMIATSRVDIGVFAQVNGTPSAPSIISVAFPTHQIRNYDFDTKGDPRLQSIDYDAIGRGAYYDPALYWSAAWMDEAVWDKNGNLVALHRDGQKIGLGDDAPTYRTNDANQARPNLEAIWD